MLGDCPGVEKENMSDCVTPSLPYVYDSAGEARDTLKEVAESARHTVDSVSTQALFHSKDRADQDRFIHAAFERLQKEATDNARFTGKEFGEVRHDLARSEARLVDSDRRTELAVEKTAAATALAINVSTAATNLAIERTAAAAQLALKDCCCEIKMLTVEQSEKTRDLVSQIDRERIQARLAVLESRFINLPAV